MKALTIFALLGAGAIGGACEPQQDLHADFGNAVEHNMAIHIIDPTPSYSGPQQIPTLDGPRAAGAQDRYDTGDVIAPERLRTSGLSGGEGE
ncbi:MAG: hypothetical protein ACREDZ_14050 [Kiloniellales bacterium]